MAASMVNITTSTTGEGSLRELGRGQPSLSGAPSAAYCDEGHSESTLKRLFGYFTDKKLCDVTLIAGGCRISAHRVVLASCSDFFRAVFTGSMKEAQLSEVSVGDVDSRALEAIVQYCYTGTIELRQETVEALLATANFMQFDRVANACCAYLQKHLHLHNCLRIAFLAEQHFYKELHEEALKYTFKHLMQVVKQDDFLAIHPDRLTSLLTSHLLNAVTVQNAFESLMAWVQHDSANREQHLAASLKLLKLHLLPPEYLLDNVERACSHVPECLPLIVGALKRRLLPEPQGSSAVGRLYAIGGDDSTTGPMSIEMYSAESNSWRHVQGVKGAKGAARRDFGAAVSRGRVIVAGGVDSQRIVFNTAVSFELSDTMVGDWSTLVPMNAPRQWTAAAALGGGPDACVYVVGGQDCIGECLRSVERWDVRAGAWTLVAPMRDARRSCGVAALRGRLYAVGGSNKTGVLNSVECYDPNTNRWSDCAPVSRARDEVSVCAAGGCLYAIGGWDGSSYLASVERYDPVADTWVTAAPLSRACAGVASCLMGDRIFAVGGEGGGHDQRTVEVYDSASDCWQELAPLNTARSLGVLVYVPPC